MPMTEDAQWWLPHNTICVKWTKKDKKTTSEWVYLFIMLTRSISGPVSWSQDSLSMTTCLYCCVFKGETADTNFSFVLRFDLNWPGSNPLSTLPETSTLTITIIVLIWWCVCYLIVLLCAGWRIVSLVVGLIWWFDFIMFKLLRTCYFNCLFSLQFVSFLKRIGGVVVSVLASGVVDRGFEPRSGQTKDY